MTSRTDTIFAIAIGLSLLVLAFCVWGLTETLICATRCPDGTTAADGPFSECRCRVDTYVEPNR